MDLTDAITRVARQLLHRLSRAATRHIHFGQAGSEIDLTFGLRNVTNARQKDLEVGATRDSDYVHVPRSPRTAFLRLNASF